MPYSLNGTAISMSAEPQLKDGTLWVPLRELSEALGAKVDWEPSNHVAILYHGSAIFTIKIGDKSVDIDGQTLELQAPPFTENGDAWVPVRFFERPLGYKVSADWEAKQVDIVNPAL